MASKQAPAAPNGAAGAIKLHVQLRVALMACPQIRSHEDPCIMGMPYSMRFMGLSPPAGPDKPRPTMTWAARLGTNGTSSGSGDKQRTAQPTLAPGVKLPAGVSAGLLAAI